MEAGLDEVARRYVLYRRRRADLREAKRMLGVRDDLKLSLNAVAVLTEGLAAKRVTANSLRSTQATPTSSQCPLVLNRCPRS